MAATTVEKQQATQAVPEPLQDGPRFIPLVDILESNDGYTFYADLPGTKAGDVDITCEDDQITIEAKVAPRPGPGQGYVVQEYGIGGFSRSFRITTPIDPDGIRAELRNGELCLFVPKAESAKVRRIAIKSD